MAKANPNIPYIWDEKSEFKITGEEFGLMRKLVGAVLRGEEVPRVILALELDKTVKRVFNQGVEDGTIYEDVSDKIVNPSRPLVGANGMPLS